MNSRRLMSNMGLPPACAIPATIPPNDPRQPAPSPPMREKGVVGTEAAPTSETSAPGLSQGFPDKLMGKRLTGKSASFWDYLDGTGLWAGSFEKAPSIAALTPTSASGVSTSTSAALPSSGTSTTASL